MSWDDNSQESLILSDSSRQHQHLHLGNWPLQRIHQTCTNLFHWTKWMCEWRVAGNTLCHPVCRVSFRKRDVKHQLQLYSDEASCMTAIRRNTRLPLYRLIFNKNSQLQAAARPFTRCRHCRTRASMSTTTTTTTTRDRGDRYGPMEWAQLVNFKLRPRTPRWLPRLIVSCSHNAVRGFCLSSWLVVWRSVSVVRRMNELTRSALECMTVFGRYKPSLYVTKPTRSTPLYPIPHNLPLPWGIWTPV